MDKVDEDMKDDVEEESSEDDVEEEDDGMEDIWEVDLGGGVYSRYGKEESKLLTRARIDGIQEVSFQARRQMYMVNLSGMIQRNLGSGATRRIRYSRMKVEAVAVDLALEVPARSERLTNLVNRLLSPAVQVPLPAEVPDEPIKLTADEVKTVFLRHVPGVETYVFREQPGNYCLNFMVATYSNGLRDYNRTPLAIHLANLFRVIVHHGHETSHNGSNYVRDLAESFKDCQAVQARTIESTGFRILGITEDLRGSITRLIGDYKNMVLTMRAMEKVRLGDVGAERNPTHFENRLIADLGDMLGLNKDVVRLASLDFHANQRHPRLPIAERNVEALRCRQLFEIESVLQALVAEVNQFSADSPKDSLAALFVKWVSENVNPMHRHKIIFDAEDYTKLKVTQPVALVILEELFLGSSKTAPDEMIGDCLVSELFLIGDTEEVNKEGGYPTIIDAPFVMEWSQPIECCDDGGRDFWVDIRRALGRKELDSDVIKTTENQQMTMDSFASLAGEDLKKVFPIQVRVDKVVATPQRSAPSSSDEFDSCNSGDEDA